MLLGAAETELGFSGFARTVYSGSPKRNRRLWYELVNR